MVSDGTWLCCGRSGSSLTVPLVMVAEWSWAWLLCMGHAVTLRCRRAALEMGRWVLCHAPLALTPCCACVPGPRACTGPAPLHIATPSRSRSVLAAKWQDQGPSLCLAAPPSSDGSAEGHGCHPSGVCPLRREPCSWHRGQGCSGAHTGGGFCSKPRASPWTSEPSQSTTSSSLARGVARSARCATARVPASSSQPLRTRTRT